MFTLGGGTTLLLLVIILDSSKQRIALKKEMRKYIETAEKILEVLNPQLDGEVVTMDHCYAVEFFLGNLFTTV
jgi:hypothetical protein